MNSASLDIGVHGSDGNSSSCEFHSHIDGNSSHHQLRREKQMPQLALIISGTMRRTGPLNGTNGTYWDHWPMMAKHVVEVLSAEAEVHSFLCINLEDELPSSEVMNGLRVLMVTRNNTGTAADTWPKGVPLDRHVSAEAQRGRWGRCFEHARHHERNTGAHFSWFVRMRPDLLWFGNIPPLSSYSERHVSVRARSLHGGYSPSHRVHPIKTTIEVLSSIRHGCEKNTDCTRLSAVRPCLVPDDNFAIVPRKLAPSYFLLEPVPPSLLAVRADRSHGNLSAPSCKRPFPSDWGNATECHHCLKCKLIFCQEFLFAEMWSRISLPMELRGFRARIHPGMASTSKGIYSMHGEKLESLLSDKYHQLPLGC